MNIQIFGTKKCFDTKKAERYFKERGIKAQVIDLKEYAYAMEELRKMTKFNLLCRRMDMSKTSEQKAAYKRDVGRRLEEERNAQNLSRRYVADQLDIVKDSYYRIEKGQLLLSPYHLETLRKVLKFDMEYALYTSFKNHRAQGIFKRFNCCVVSVKLAPVYNISL